MGEKLGFWRDIFGFGFVCGVMFKFFLIGDIFGLFRDFVNLVFMFF